MEESGETDTVVEHAFNALNLAAWALGGAAVGLLVAIVLLFVVHLSGKKSELMNYMHRRTRAPLCWAMAVFGAWAGFGFSGQEEALGNLYGVIRHVLLLLVIATMGWFGVALAGLIQDAATIRIQKDARDAQRLQTQSQVVRRVLQAIVVIVAVIAALLTFPAARAPLTSILASAGVISVVVGLAAQSSLGNAFAGLQLAFTDAIRVGDTVTIGVGNTSEAGVVEELTLTYVVLRLWDERRVLLPSTEFTTKPFENWSRRDTEQLGTIFLQLDWTVPMAQLRQQVQKIVKECDLWDGRTWNVQMVASPNTVPNPVVRIVVSANNPGDLHDLKCEVREQVVAWIVKEIPWALPRGRNQTMEVQQINQDIGEERVAELAQELADISGKTTGRYGVPDHDPIHAARLAAAKQKTKTRRVRRRSVVNEDSTMVITGGERLFSGSPDAEERRKIYDGPGDETIKRREETAIMQALDAQGKLKETKDDD